MLKQLHSSSKPAAFTSESHFVGALLCTPPLRPAIEAAEYHWILSPVAKAGGSVGVKSVQVLTLLTPFLTWKQGFPGHTHCTAHCMHTRAHMHEHAHAYTHTHIYNSKFMFLQTASLQRGLPTYLLTYLPIFSPAYIAPICTHTAYLHAHNLPDYLPADFSACLPIHTYAQSRTMLAHAPQIRRTFPRAYWLRVLLCRAMPRLRRHDIHSFIVVGPFYRIKSKSMATYHILLRSSKRY